MNEAQNNRSTSNGPDEGITLAQRIRACMAAGRPHRPKPWTQLQVREALAQQGVYVSQSYFSELSRGVRAEPKLAVLRGLTKVFGVPWGYFMADDEEALMIENYLENRRDSNPSPDDPRFSLEDSEALNDPYIAGIADLLSGLNSQGRQMAREIIQNALESNVLTKIGVKHDPEVVSISASARSLNAEGRQLVSEIIRNQARLEAFTASSAEPHSTRMRRGRAAQSSSGQRGPRSSMV